MPNEGDRAKLGSEQVELVDREAQIASRVRDAASHPKASLFFAIASRCNSPNEAAKVAEEELCLEKEEIQHTRWIALFKKGKTRDEFFLGLKELLGTTQPTEEQKMEVKRGKGFFLLKARPLVRKLYQDLLDSGVQFEGEANSGELSELDDEVRLFTAYPSNGTNKILALEITDAGGEKHTFACDSVSVKDISGGDMGFWDVELRVNNIQAMKAVRSFARRWEAKSKQLRGSREATVTIFQDFA